MELPAHVMPNHASSQGSDAGWSHPVRFTQKWGPLVLEYRSASTASSVG